MLSIQWALCINFSPSSIGDIQICSPYSLFERVFAGPCRSVMVLTGYHVEFDKVFFSFAADLAFYYFRILVFCFLLFCFLA